MGEENIYSVEFLRVKYARFLPDVRHLPIFGFLSSAILMSRHPLTCSGALMIPAMVRRPLQNRRLSMNGCHLIVFFREKISQSMNVRPLENYNLDSAQPGWPPWGLTSYAIDAQSL